MTITREQVADLQPGDVVELTFLHEYDATTFTARGTFPAVVDWFENHEGGKYTLTVVSPAPRPLYVNHPRTEPVAGDVVRDGGNDKDERTWSCLSPNTWKATWSNVTFDFRQLPTTRRLLVDGSTGQVVP